MTPLERLNSLPPDDAERELLACCGSHRWARRMAGARPFADADALLAQADAAWWSLGPADWLEAFRSHPRIGESKTETPQSERERQWSAGEQSGMGTAADATRRGIAEGNRAYEARFGYIYIVCATGRTAEQMLELLRQRLGNDPEAELRVAAEEQHRITRLRLTRLVEE
jgi:OHCU decarboxylase